MRGGCEAPYRRVSRGGAYTGPLPPEQARRASSSGDGRRKLAQTWAPLWWDNGDRLLGRRRCRARARWAPYTAHSAGAFSVIAPRGREDPWSRGLSLFFSCRVSTFSFHASTNQPHVHRAGCTSTSSLSTKSPSHALYKPRASAGAADQHARHSSSSASSRPLPPLYSQPTSTSTMDICRLLNPNPAHGKTERIGRKRVEKACPACTMKNHIRTNYCRGCNYKLRGPPRPGAPRGVRYRAHAAASANLALPPAGWGA